ncbi:nuclear transport factor 2 family protein [Catellatospora sp. KI3]|uniref:nuclear transport factor 2 family protein n=1 Tax=Catellatospora sp. KI3 TaxID=3041620 RepID=UPI0024824929|nr:nuclear transport factor 2 family protein [Catellatospora sp. KI3]MDI1465842.1 nuclear transport factor 2 family protein [Catellatospora sp. KI3]
MDALGLMDAFNAAWNGHDIEAALDLCTHDVVFESTDPAPDGRRFEGRDEVREAWLPVFLQLAGRFDVEELTASGDLVVQRWRYDWGTGHVRGVDVIRVRDGLVAEKLSYVKG